MKFMLVAGARAGALLSSYAASAAVFADRASFRANVAVAVTETFEGYETGRKDNPFRFVNGSVTATGAPFVSDESSFCGAPGKCLTALGGLDTRTFGGFAAGTTGVGFDFRANGPNDSFVLTAVTGGGTMTFALTAADTFFGLSDATGITSISVRNTSNADSYGSYAFDNLSTGYLARRGGAPSFSDRAAFEAAAPAGAATAVETFEGYATGFKSGTFRVGNASLTAGPPVYVAPAGEGFCSPGSGQCAALLSNSGPVVLGDFAPGTTGVGFDLNSFSDAAVFSVIADTGSGIRTFELTGADRFFGVTDALGINSIRVLNEGFPDGEQRVIGSYAFDNLATFAGTPLSAAVPEPGTWALMLAGFGVIGAASRARRRRGSGSA